MKKFRMMLPMLAFVFAAVGAIAGNLFAPPISAYYRINSTTCSSAQSTEQGSCVLSDDTDYDICTIQVGLDHPQAFKNANCTGVLRNVTPQ